MTNKLSSSTQDPCPRYNNDLSLWTAKHQDFPDFLATSKAKKESLLRGVQEWTFYNDSCFSKMTYTKELLLTGCTDDEFTCNDAMCLEISLRCDGQHDCKDGSDEAGCEAFIKSVGYNKFLVPPRGDGKLNVSFAVTIKKIVHINELEGYIEMKVGIKREWFDSQLTYQNIKKDKNNLIFSKDWEIIWSPFIIFENIESKEMMKETDKFHKIRVIPNEDFRFELGDDTLLHNTQLFSGSQNSLQWQRELTIEWLCDFHMEWYPFDTQSCTMEFLNDLETLNFVPSDVAYLGPLELQQHFVKDVKMCSKIILGDQKVIVEVILGRPVFSSFMTTTLPTGMLILISQMATAFSENFLDMVIEVNLTVLLVLATL